MADMQEITIEVRPPRSTSADEDFTGSDDKVLQWLSIVDDHIDNSSIEIMKLGLRTELTQTERDKAKKASDLYHALTNHIESEALLARYVYALEKLGRRRHGFRAVRRLSEFSIEKPVKFDPTSKPLEFSFHQCLVDISVHLNTSCHPRLIAYAAKALLDGANPRLIKSPHELLIKLLQMRVISKDDQKDLMEALHIIGADKCVEYIHCYRHQNGLPEIADLNMHVDYNKETLVSTTSSTTDEGSRMQTLKRSVNNDEQDNRDDLVRSPSVQKTSSGHPRGWIFCFALMAIIVILLILAAAILLGLTTVALLRNRTSISLYHDNVTRKASILSNYKRSGEEVINLSEDDSSSDHEIDLYLLNRECNSLRIDEIKYTIYDHNIFALNKTALYLLPGSFITYSICASTNHTKYLDRLELVVLDNLERARSFDIGDSFYTFTYFSVGVEEDIRCSDETISIDKAGYYYFVIFPPLYPAEFELNVTYTIRWIDPTQFSETEKIHTLRKNQDIFEIVSSPQANKRSCLVATFKRAAKPFVHIRLQFNPFLETKVGMGVGGAMLVIELLLIMLVLMICHQLLIAMKSR